MQTKTCYEREFSLLMFRDFELFPIDDQQINAVRVGRKVQSLRSLSPASGFHDFLAVCVEDFDMPDSGRAVKGDLACGRVRVGFQISLDPVFVAHADGDFGTDGIGFESQFIASFVE